MAKATSNLGGRTDLRFRGRNQVEGAGNVLKRSKTDPKKADSTKFVLFSMQKGLQRISSCLVYFGALNSGDLPPKSPVSSLLS